MEALIATKLHMLHVLPTFGNRCLAVFWMVAFVVADSAAREAPQQGLRFNSPGVLDLAERMQKIAGAHPLSVTALDAADTTAILAAPALTEEQSALAFSDDVYNCKPASLACSQEHERALIAVAHGTVKRIDKRLIVAAGGGKPLVFIDWKMPETKVADGDEERHWYLGRVPGTGYYRVEVQFGHDAPGNFLINPQSGKITFVHNGADVVSLSPDGMRLVTFNTLNPPLSIRVAALDAAGPQRELQCEVDANARSARIQFKGWHGMDGFDLVLEPVQSKPSSALRIARRGGTWSIAASDAGHLAETGFTCH